MITLAARFAAGLASLWTRFSASFASYLAAGIAILAALTAIIAQSRKDGRTQERLRAQERDIERASQIRDAVNRARNAERVPDDTRGYRRD